MQAALVCPHCRTQLSCDLPHEGWLDGTCLGCKKAFRTLLTRIRAKRSRGNGWGRAYDVRVKHNGQEQLLQFAAPTPGDFELRSSDRAAFQYVGEELHVVQNLTINKYLVVKRPSNWLVAVIVLAVIAGVLFAIFRAAFWVGPRLP